MSLIFRTPRLFVFSSNMSLGGEEEYLKERGTSIVVAGISMRKFAHGRGTPAEQC